MAEPPGRASDGTHAKRVHGTSANQAWSASQQVDRSQLAIGLVVLYYHYKSEPKECISENQSPCITSSAVPSNQGMQLLVKQASYSVT